MGPFQVAKLKISSIFTIQIKGKNPLITIFPVPNNQSFIVFYQRHVEN
jgi:hypothetical protein